MPDTLRELTDAQRALAGKMLERELEANVASTCKTLALLYYHTHRSQHSPAGFPDDVIVGGGRILYRELKREREKPSAAQQGWLDALAEAGQDVGVWRPSDWFSGRILSELQALSTRQ